MVYTSLKNDKIKEIIKLKDKKYRDKYNLFLIEGEHLIEEAIKMNLVKEVIYEEGYENSKFIPTMIVSKSIYKELTFLETPASIIGVCKKSDITIQADKILAIDKVQDPGNIGTIIRSALGFNFKKILISKNSADVYSPKVIRATQGAIFALEIKYVDLKAELTKYKKEYKLLSTDVEQGKSPSKFKNEKVIVIMGNEGSGVSEEIKDICDDYIYIKTNEQLESLNVGVAASIIMYELNKED